MEPDQKPQSAENRPSNCQGWQFENVAMKLPRAAIWVHKKKCGSNGQGWQFYGNFFKLPNKAGLPKCLGAHVYQIKDKIRSQLLQYMMDHLTLST